jgi:predicted hydrocarbon binding protein
MTKHGALITLQNYLEQVMDKSAAAEIMQGSEHITEKSDKKETAQWTKNAMKRFEDLADEKTRVQVMQNCGYNCAKKNKKIIEKAMQRREKYNSTDDFIIAEQKNPIKGTRLVREGNILYYYYTPQTFTRPMRCYCSLFKGLPSKETVSLTYCNCSKGFVEKYWEAILQKPTKVDLIQSAISGTKECKFAIHLNHFQHKLR